MYCYKYYKGSDLDFQALSRSEIYFAAIEQLNDSQECRPAYFFNGSQELYYRFVHYALVRVAVGCAFLDENEKKCLISGSEKISVSLKRQFKNKDVSVSEAEAHIWRGLVEFFLQSAPKEKIESIYGVFLRFFRNDLYKIIFEPRYLVSFTKSAINPTMWGHYANADKGFLIIFKLDDDGCISVTSRISNLNGFRDREDGMREIGIYSQEKLPLHPVRYRKRPPRVNVFHKIIHRLHFSEMEDHYDAREWLVSGASEKEQELNGLIKYTDWKYEREIRAFYPSYYEVPQDFRALQVDIHQVKGIVFGRSMSTANRERVVQCVQLMRSSCVTKDDVKEDFYFYDAISENYRFELRVKPCGVLSQSEYGYGQVIPFKRASELQKEAMLSMASNLNKQ